MGDAKLHSLSVNLPGARPLMKPLNKKLLYFHNIKCKVNVFFEFNVKRAASSISNTSLNYWLPKRSEQYKLLSIIIGFSCISVNKGTN